MAARTTRRGCATAAEGTKGAGRRLRVLVVYKKTSYTEVLEKNDQATLELIRKGHASVRKIVPTHEEHERTLAAVQNELAQRNIEFKAIPRELMGQELSTSNWDAVATVGGDGTVLEASHYVQCNVPILGINSAVCSSHGHYAIANLTNLGTVLDEILSGKRRPISVMRMRYWLDGEPLAELALNEILVADGEKGAAARYILYLNDRQTEQMADGLYIGGPGGSTGGMRSYGGKILPIKSRRFLYVTKGLIIRRPEDLLYRKGVLDKGDMVRVVSRMGDGVLMIDGKHVCYPFKRGSELIAKPSCHDLLLYTDADVNEKYARLHRFKRPRPQKPTADQRKEAAEARKRWLRLHD